MRGEVGKKTPQKEMDFYDVTRDNLGFLVNRDKLETYCPNQSQENTKGKLKTSHWLKHFTDPGTYFFISFTLLD